MFALRHLKKYYAELQNEPSPLYHIEPLDPNSDMKHWSGWIKGPEDTPYAHGKFHLSIDFSNEYPFKPPKIKFLTPIYHPNIATDGEICLDILHSQWSPALSIRSILISLCSLLADPNPEHGLNKEALSLYRSDKNQYENRVRQWVNQNALN